MKIATAQSIVSNSVQENGAVIRSLIKEAKAQGASLVHFCEGALSGYTKQQVGYWEAFDFNGIRAEIKLIQCLCKQLNIWTVVGSAHQLSNSHKPHNSLYIISNDGNIVNRYDKRMCSHNELENWFSPGFDVCTFEISGIKFSCVICIEIQFSEIFRAYEKMGVDCVLFSSYSRDPMFGIQAQGYAAINNYWISMSVPTNESHLQSSQFIGPNGEIVDKCPKNKTDLIISEMNKNDEKWEIALNFAKPWRKEARIGKIYIEKRVFVDRSTLKTIT